MSIKIMTQVWSDAPVRGGDLLILLALADWADEDTRQAYPGIKKLASKSRLSERQTQYAVAKLNRLGLISIKRNASPLKTNLYTISVCIGPDTQKLHPNGETPDTQKLHPQDATHCVIEAQPIAPKPSVTPVIKPSVLFDEFWAAVPKKADKPKAMRAFAQAVKRKDPQEIISAMRRYAKTRVGEDQKYTKTPAPWLNSDGWENDLTSGKKGQPRMDEEREMGGRKMIWKGSMCGWMALS